MRKTSPAWSFRGRSLQLISKAAPGPGSYSPSRANLETSPSFRIGKSKRLDSTYKFAYPGPGNYNPEKPTNNLANTV